MIKRFCLKAGLNYVWGLVNFAAGVAAGAGVAGFTLGLAG